MVLGGGRRPGFPPVIDRVPARLPKEGVRQLGGHFSVDLDPPGR